MIHKIIKFKQKKIVQCKCSRSQLCKFELYFNKENDDVTIVFLDPYADMTVEQFFEIGLCLGFRYR